jgi:hypothetical protein
MTYEEIKRVESELERARRIEQRITPAGWSEEGLISRVDDYEDSNFILYARNELLGYFIKFTEQLLAERHEPRGTALLARFNDVNACAPVTQYFMNYQPTEHIICSCGVVYPKGTEHKHT